jgi:hypothetical protein
LISSLFSNPLSLLPTWHKNKEQRALHRNFLPQRQCRNSITDIFYSTFLSYYVSRSRLKAQTEFSFKRFHNHCSSEQRIHLSENFYFVPTQVYILYFISKLSPLLCLSEVAY